MFEHGLLVLGVVVLRVLADVTELARLFDALCNLQTLVVRKVVNLFLELLKTLGCEQYFFHGIDVSSEGEGGKKSGATALRDRTLYERR